MATKNSLNNKSQELTLDPGASGDSFLQFDINSTGEFRIGVDDTDDSFRISQGSALGTNDTFVMTAAGERTMPLQSAFLAYLGTTDSNATGDGTNYTLGSSGNALTEVFDQNSDFNTNGTFTAPVTGKFLLTTTILMDDLVAAHVTSALTITTSNRTYLAEMNNPGAMQSSGDLSFTLSVLADMDASDTATVTFYIAGSTKVVDVISTGASSSFGGSLIC